MTTIVTDSLRLGHGFHERERAHVVDLLGRLDERLRTFDADRVQLELSVKERDGAGQRTTLEAKVGGMRRLVATSDHETLDAAVLEVREELVRQLNDAAGRTETKSRHRAG